MAHAAGASSVFVPRQAANGVEWLPVACWASFPWLWHGFSTRKGGLSRAYSTDGATGELNLGFTADDERETVLANRRLLAEAVTGRAETPLIALRQFHSEIVTRVADLGTDLGAGLGAAQAEPCQADGQITDRPGLLLAIQTADCIPVLLADTKRRAVGAFHAGWRGTVKRIVESGVGRMSKEFGSRPEDLIAAIGPGIGGCCYAVGPEVRSEFESQFSYASELFREMDSVALVHSAARPEEPGFLASQSVQGRSSTARGLHLDLVEANRRQLLDAGLEPGSIQIVGGCTNCRQDLFFSHRASKGRAGRMMAVIGIRAK